jgi:Cytidine and deoxycytidylate deaminase zinc-binding region
MTPLGENVPFTDYGGSAVSSVSSSVPSSYPVGAELNNLVSSGALLAGRTLIPYGTAVLRGENATGTWQDSMLGFLKGGYNLAAGLATLTSPGLMATDGSIPQLPIGKREIGGAAAFELAAMMLPVGVESSLAARGGVSLAERAAQIHGALDPIAQAQRTTAVLRTTAGDIVAGGARDLTPAQRALLGPGEIAARAPGVHAEATALGEAARMGATPLEMAVTRVICPQCAAAIEASGGRLTSPTTVVWP